MSTEIIPEIPIAIYRPFCLWFPGWQPDRRPVRWELERNRRCREAAHPILVELREKEERELEEVSVDRLPDWRRINRNRVFEQLGTQEAKKAKRLKPIER